MSRLSPPNGDSSCRTPVASSRPYCRTRFGASLALAGFQLFAPPAAQAASADLVITEVYGAGGNAGRRPSTPTSSSSGTRGRGRQPRGQSIQYRSSTGDERAACRASAASSRRAAAYLVQHQRQRARRHRAAHAEPDRVAGDRHERRERGGHPGNSTTAITAHGQHRRQRRRDRPGRLRRRGHDVRGCARRRRPTRPPPRSGPTSADGDNNATDFSELCRRRRRRPGPGRHQPGKRVVVNQPITSFNLAATGGTPPYTFNRHRAAARRRRRAGRRGHRHPDHRSAPTPSA